MLIDLHIHTNASDGSFSPSDAIAYAKTVSIGAIAITDHDSIDGVAEAQGAATSNEIIVVPGIELTGNWRDAETHFLGYYIDPDSDVLKTMITRTGEARREQRRTAVDDLRRAGFEITHEEVAASTDRSRGGWPLLNVMIDKGFVKDVYDFFDRFFGPGQPFHREPQFSEAQDVIAAIKAAKGLAVLAHPGALRAPVTHKDIEQLVEYGTDGIEAISSYHDSEQELYFRKLAEETGVLITGGSDCHGTFLGEIRMGTLEIQSDLLDALAERHRTLFSSNV